MALLCLLDTYENSRELQHLRHHQVFPRAIQAPLRLSTPELTHIPTVWDAAVALTGSLDHWICSAPVGIGMLEQVDRPSPSSPRSRLPQHCSAHGVCSLPSPSLLLTPFLPLLTSTEVLTALWGFHKEKADECPRSQCRPGVGWVCPGHQDQGQLLQPTT